MTFDKSQIIWKPYSSLSVEHGRNLYWRLFRISLSSGDGRGWLEMMVKKLEGTEVTARLPCLLGSGKSPCFGIRKIAVFFHEKEGGLVEGRKENITQFRG